MAVLDRQHMLRKVKQLGQRDAHFTFSSVRDAYGIEPTDREAKQRIWNWWKQLERDAIVEQVAGKRKRNRYYRLRDPERLESLVSGNGLVTTVPSDRPSPSDRLSRLETKISAVEERLQEIGRKLDQLIAVWA
jgi:hypothetical protein